MTIEVKSCPFCGGFASINIMPIKGYKGCFHYKCECVNCHAVAPNGVFDDINITSGMARKKAIEAWNRRAET